VAAYFFKPGSGPLLRAARLRAVMPWNHLQTLAGGARCGKSLTVLR
jgi:hypothetical protein